MLKTTLPLALAALTISVTSKADVPTVAVDIAPVHSLVSQVMGTLGEPALIVSPGASPHSYSLRPSEAQSLQDAHLVFWTSAGLTPWLADTIVTLAPEATRVELIDVEGVNVLEVREGALFEAHEHHDEEHGHDEHASESEDDNHGEHDSHAWLDPSNASIWLDAIALELSNEDPANSEVYLANAATGKAALEQLKTDVQETLKPVNGRSFIVFHDAYQYFENAFDFPAAGAISIGDASKPSPARIQQIQDRVATANVTCVLSEPQFNPDLVNTVLDGTDAHSSVLDPLGAHLDIGPTLYSELMLELAQTLADCV